MRKHIIRLLNKSENEHQKKAQRKMERFDANGWRKLSRKLEDASNFFPLGSVVYQRLALARLHEAAKLHEQAVKKGSGKAWHEVRDSLKQFRYLIENFLPQLYAAWAEDLKWMQDALGDIHDLDVLSVEIRKQAPQLNRADVSQWLEKINWQRKSRLQEFLKKSSAKNSPWVMWQAGLQLDRAPVIHADVQHRRTA